jgi:hypothetical protein
MFTLCVKKSIICVECFRDHMVKNCNLMLQAEHALNRGELSYDLFHMAGNRAELPGLMMDLMEI